MYYLLLLWLLYCSIRAASERMNLSPWFRTCPPFSQAHPFFHNNNVITGRGGKKRKNISSIFLFFSSFFFFFFYLAWKIDLDTRVADSKMGCFCTYDVRLSTLLLFPGVRSYLKEALVNIITVHAEVEQSLTLFFLRWSCMNEEDSLTPPFVVFSFPQRFVWQVFTISKDLVPCVLSKILATVADEMCRLMQCVSSFSKNGALQVFSSHTHSKQLQVSFPRLWESHVCDCRLPS